MTTYPAQTVTMVRSSMRRQYEHLTGARTFAISWRNERAAREDCVHVVEAFHLADDRQDSEALAAFMALMPEGSYYEKRNTRVSIFMCTDTSRWGE